jgi:hypothetical protein
MRRRELLSATALGGAAILLPTPAQAAPSDLADLTGIATAYLSDRSCRVTASRSSRQTVAATSAQHGKYSADAARLEDVRTRLDHLHGGYLRASTSLRVGSSEVKGRMARLKVTEHTKLYFADRSADADHTAYESDHELEFHRSTRGWLLNRATYLAADPFSTPVTQFSDELPAHVRSAVPAPSTAADPHGTSSSSDRSFARTNDETKMGILSYNYTAMVNYARAWAFSYNSDYPSYPPDLDCTNFTSQCLHQGGWQLVTGFYQSNSVWWYTWANKSYTWGGSENWFQFSYNNAHRTYLLNSIYDLVASDILQYDYGPNGNIDHNQICTGKASGTPLMTQHGGSLYRDRPLNEIMLDSSNANARKYAHRT